MFERAALGNLRKNPKLWEELTAYRAHSPATGASYADYWLLYSIIRRLRPKEVLECGTGLTTIVLAAALADNDRDFKVKGRVTSMENIPKYHEQAKKLFPERLLPYTDLRQSEKVEDSYYLFRGVRYREIPERPYSFVYVDGPKTSIEDPVTGKKTKTFNMDLIRVVEQSTVPVYALVDTRISTCFVFEKIFKEGTVRFDYAREVGVVGPVTKNDLL